MDKKEIKQKADHFLHQNGIETAPVDVLDLCSRNGIAVYEADLGDSSGAIIINSEPMEEYGGHTRVIVVNKLHSATRQRFSIAHELGHFVLDSNYGKKEHFAHRETTYDVYERDQGEWDADTFAENILMPEQLVRKACKTFKELKAINPFTYSSMVSHISIAFAVSEKAAETRLSHLGIRG